VEPRRRARLRCALALGAALMVCSVASGAEAADATPLPSVNGCDPVASIVGSTPSFTLTIASPKEGVAGSIISKPNPLPPADADPFVPGSKWSMYQVYGYAGLGPRTYDVGCSPGDVANAAIETSLVGKIVGASTAFSAMAGAAQEEAYSPSWLSVFSNLSDAVHSAISDKIFWRYTPVGLLVAAAFLLVSFGRKGDLAGSSRAIGLGLLFLVVAVFVLPYPTMVATAAQKALSEVNRELTAGTSDAGTGTTTQSAAVAASSRVYDVVHYRQWLTRTFGDPDSPTAKTYGAALFRAGTGTWSDLVLCEQKDKSACQKMTDAKVKQYEDIAAKIKDADPVAYDYFRGVKDTTGSAVVELVFAFCADLFRLLAAVVVAIAVASLVILALAFPVAAPLIVAHPWHGIGLTMLNAGKSALLNAAGFGAVAVLWSMVVQAVLSPALGLTWFWQVVVIGLLTAAVVMALHPIRAVVGMLSLGGYAKHGRGLMNFALDKGATAWAAAKGVEWRSQKRPNDEEDEAVAPSFTPAPSQPTMPPPEPMPMPVPATEPATEPAPGRVVTGAALPASPRRMGSDTAVEPLLRQPRPSKNYYQRPPAPQEAVAHETPDGVQVFNVTSARDSYQRPDDRVDA